MTDVFTKAKRSEVMARIRSRGNKDTELALAKLLRAHRITGWRRHVVIRGRDVALRRPRPGQDRNNFASKRTVARGIPPGLRVRTSQRDVPTFQVRPDFVFPKIKLVIFVDGCFWHGCPKHATQPKNNAAFWLAKLSGNRTRDALVTRTLRRAGWRVLRIWECALQRATKKPAQQARLLQQILRALEFQDRINEVNRI